MQMMVDHTKMRIQLPQQLWQLFHCLLHQRRLNDPTLSLLRSCTQGFPIGVQSVPAGSGQWKAPLQPGALQRQQQPVGKPLAFIRTWNMLICRILAGTT